MTADAIRTKLDEMEAVEKAATPRPWYPRTAGPKGCMPVCDEEGVWFATGPGHDPEDIDQPDAVAERACEQAAHADSAFIALARTDWPATIAALRIAVEALEDADHERECIRSRFEGGRPTDDGRYEQKFAGKWYEASPVDRTPKCDCLLAAALAAIADALGGTNG